MNIKTSKRSNDNWNVGFCFFFSEGNNVLCGLPVNTEECMTYGLLIFGSIGDMSNWTI